MVDLIRRGVLTRDHTVVFIHTGGGVGNFATPNCFDLFRYFKIAG